MKNKKEILRAKRHKTIRLRLHGTQEKPRLLIRRSLKNIFIEVKDDVANKTLCSFSTLDKEVRTKFPQSGNVKSADFFGTVVGKRLKEKGITTLVFDRAGYLYHGRVKALADSLRKSGIAF